MACQVTRDPITREITSVRAPNGSPSILFRDINNLLHDKENSLNIYANAYTPSFKLKFGDWERYNELVSLSDSSRFKDYSSHDIMGIAHDDDWQSFDYDGRQYKVVQGEEWDDENESNIQLYFAGGREITRDEYFDAYRQYSGTLDKHIQEGLSLAEQNELKTLSTHVSHLLDENGEPKIEALTDYFPEGTRLNMGSQLKSKINKFLSSIGVSVEVARLPKDINAQRELLSKTIKIATGQENDLSILGEEAAHFYVSLLPKDSSLYRDMINRITSLPIYKDVLNSYGNNPQYRLSDGKPDFTKLKEEAIGKVISNLMINEEGPKNWLTRILEFIKKLFNVRNPFMVAAENILSAKIEGLDPIDNIKEESIMYNLTSNNTVQQNYDNLISISNRISKRETNIVDPETGKKKEKYFIDNTEIDKRVTDLAKKFYENRFGTNRTDKSKREIYNLQAEQGTAIHKDIEDIERRYIDENGKLRSKPLPQEGHPATNEEVYYLLEEHLGERLVGLIKKYGPETRFLPEVKVYDPSSSTAGTIDLLILKPNGRVDILDWKSQDFNTGKIKDGVPWWKQEAYTIQLDEYARILMLNYNIETDLKRAIPIRAIFSKDSKGKYTNLDGIEIGSSVISNIPEDQKYLLPVPSKTEKTGIGEVDKLLERLRNLYEEIRSRKVSVDQKFIRDQELEKIKNAINSLQVNESLVGVVENGVLLINNVRKALNESSLNPQSAITYYKELLMYSDITKVMSAMEKAGFGQSLNESQKSAVYELSGSANALESDLKDYILTGANEVSSAVGVKEVTNIEESVGFWSGLVRSLSNAATNTVKTFYKYLTSFQNQIRERTQENNDVLKKLKSELEQWSKVNNIPTSRIFDGILEIDEKGRWNGSFLYKYNREFRDLKRKYIEERNIDGLLSILDINNVEVKNKFIARKKKFIEWLNSTSFSLDNETNAKIKDRKLEDWNYRYDVYTDKYRTSALLNYENNIPGKDQYLSTKWKNLQEERNAPLRRVYEHFQSMLNYADHKLGMIDNSGKFIPNVENDKLDMLNQYGLSTAFNMKGLFESFEYKTNNTFGEIDPITGKPKRTIPKLFLNNLGVVKKDEVSGETYTDFSLKSKDLFTVFSIWGRHMYEYEYMSNLEEVGSLMLMVEDIKGKHLQKDKSGKYVEVVGNEKNFEYLDDFVNYYVYGQKLKDANAWEFELFGKNYSGKRLVQGLIRYMAMKTLSFNTLSIAANYTGGKFNTFFVASKGKFFNKKQWAQGEYYFSTDKGKAAINFFDVFLEDEAYRKSQQLSVYKSTQVLTYDNLFIGQRKTDEFVQYPTLLAMMQSYGIVNNEIVNLREHVQNQKGYANIFNLPIDEQKRLMSEIESETRELEKTNSLWNLAKIEGTGKDAKLVVPGLDRKSDTVLKFRNAVKRANKSILGNATSEDISRYRMTLLGQALGQFRNWMPPLIDERFGELRYNVDTENWVQGRARSLFNNYFATSPTNQNISKKALEILSKHVGALIKDIIGFTSLEDLQNRGKQLYLKAKAHHIEMNLPFDISEHEFVQLHLENVRSMLNELRLILSFTALVFSVSLVAGDDRDREYQGIARYLTRSIDKFNNELLFYYIPSNFVQLVQSPIPLTSLLIDIGKFFTSLAGQGYATFTGDPELDQKFKPTKYILKDIPIAKEIYTLGTIFDEDMRKSYEVTR